MRFLHRQPRAPASTTTKPNKNANRVKQVSSDRIDMRVTLQKFQEISELCIHRIKKYVRPLERTLLRGKRL